MKHLHQIVAGFALVLCGSIAAFAQAGDPPAAVKAALEKDAVCTACHDQNWPKPILAYYQTKHGNKADPRTPGCQTCHGPSEAHVKASGGEKPDIVFAVNSKNRSAADVQNAQCLSCHTKDQKRLHWEGSPHQRRDVTCATCHDIHAPQQRVMNKLTQMEVCFNCHKAQRAQIMRISTHPIEAGKVACSDCHNPHGSTAPSQLVRNTVNETCYTCHAEKRGPFLWEHPPASDDCLNCHTPHGSTTEPLLKARSPWLCQQCHGDGAPHPGNLYSANSLPGGAVANANRTGVINPITGAPITANNPPAQLAFRGCTNCHTQIHGSNSPNGNRFLR